MERDNKKLFYISTNGSWSGSEELWSRSATDFYNRGYSIVFATKYNHIELSKIRCKYYNFSNRFKKGILKKIIERFLRVQLKSRDILREAIKNEQPALVILSQGNNIDVDGIMECCYKLSIPYITITHLVTEYFFLKINHTNLYTYQQGYLNAIINFFVSQQNLDLNNLMFAVNLSNAEIIYNPCKIRNEEIPVYPNANEVYNIGLVGRIECFHKGYDLLLQLASAEKWQKRPLHFNIYGEGPHKELLSLNIARLKLNNITLKGFENSIDKVWKENHILFMPSRMEGQALSLIEAMFCHRAAIVTNVGGATSLIEDGVNGFIADSATVKSLNETLERAWDKRETWKKLGSNASITLKEKYAENAVEYFNQKVLNELNKIKAIN